MALPAYTISTTILNVDCSASGKIVYLPPASTIQGVSLWIRDGAGNCSQTNSIFISTTGLDRIDLRASTLRLSTAYQSIRCVPWQSTQYAIVQNFTQGLVPFRANFVQNLVWTPRDSSRTWSGATVSSSGTIQAACVGGGGGQIYVTTNEGSTWTPYGPTVIWTAIASSSNGNRFVAVTSGDRIYISSDTGVTWTPRESFKSWTCVCSSANGGTLLAGTSSDFLFVSTDGGGTWTATNLAANYTAVACSSDGTVQYAVTNGGTIYVSTDSGTSWTSRDSVRSWTGVACSGDGTIAFATEGTYIYKTSNTGATWTPNTVYPGTWRTITCSSSGLVVIAVESTTGSLYFSGTGGAQYILSGDPAAYSALATNPTGTTSLAASNPGRLYVGLLQLL